VDVSILCTPAPIVLICCSNTLSAGPPALALGLEPTASDAMDLPPSSFQSIFTLEFYADLIFYGLLMGSLSLVNFVIVLWGYFPVSPI
jgi:Na+-exporting ATPase